MATLEDINILDRQPTDYELLLKSGRQPVAEPIPPSLSPVRDYFYENILNPEGRKLVDMVRAEVNNPLNYLAGAGGISKAGRGIAGTVVSDDVARQIFKADEEMDALKVLNKRKDRLETLTTVYYDKIPPSRLNQLEKEYEIIEDNIRNLESNIQAKVVKRFDKNLQSRTIDKLDPVKIGNSGRIGMQDVLDATTGQKNKAIIGQLGKYLDSPGVDYTGTRYATTKFESGVSSRYTPYSIQKPYESKYKFEDKFPDANPEEIREMMFSPKAYQELMNPTSKTKVGKQGIATLINPLESFEKMRTVSQTFQVGDTFNPLFVDPKKLANKLERSGAGDDFFKLRANEKGYLDNLENSIKKHGYGVKELDGMPSPIDIVVQPSGNTVISEGNHRLYRALSKGDAEVPIQIRYEAGAERLDVPFGIRDIDSLLADGQTGIKNAKQFQKYIDDVNKTYKPASTKIADDIDKIAQGISNRQQQIAKLQRELELEGGDMLPKTVKSTEKKIVKLMKEIDEMSK